MKLKRFAAVYGSVGLILVVFLIYATQSVTKYQGSTYKYQDFDGKIKNNWSGFGKYSKKHQKSGYDNHGQVQSGCNRNASCVREFKYEASCPFEVKSVPKSDVQMLELYSSLNFDNVKGGVWTQGFDIDVDETEWDINNKLKVFVVPHSHNDPGWKETFESYYTSLTKHILDNMLIKLPEDPRRKFIWAEISYFSHWWMDLKQQERENVKKLLQNNQLEIVTGGWVMNDEANSHWVSVMHQLTEGHQWLQKHVNYTPLSSWSIDPFGLSLTQPALLRNMGLQNLLVQRVHYSVKKHLASEQQLEFRWSQLWDGTDKTALFTHVMPFYAYDIPHTCGPDPKVCCQFDFRRLYSGMSCEWNIQPQVISKRNVAERAKLLLDQYRKKSKLYKTNVVIAPLGSDFRYDTLREWDAQYENYQKLFDYMNSNVDLNVEAQFGTLSDYFSAVHMEKDAADFPTLTGDFFTYSDVDEHYWSGYYTSRPFYKRMDRVLLSYIRSAEMIHALAHIRQKLKSPSIFDGISDLGERISEARQSLALFQHHDGITGTAKSWVVIDYANKLLSAIRGCQNVIQICAHMLLQSENANTPTNESNYYAIDDVRHSHDSLSKHHQITLDLSKLPAKEITIFNSLTFTRQEVVTFQVSTPFIELLDFQGKRVDCQISPDYGDGSSSMSLIKYQLSFIANVRALGLTSYTVRAIKRNELPEETSISTIRILNYNGADKIASPFNSEFSASSTEFFLQTTRFAAAFSKTGLLKALKVGDTVFPINLNFAKYSVTRGGAYLFFPKGNPEPISAGNPTVHVVEGPIMSFVKVDLPYVHHIATLYKSYGADGLGLEVQNIVDITRTGNFELVMRLSSNINNLDEFFTDVNGYQVMRRKRFKKLPLQANYYPMPTMAYIEDNEARLSVVTSSPLGCSSPQSGQIEVMMDRKLNQDDNLGLSQAIQDNHPTRHIFRILMETKNQPCSAASRGHPAGFPTVSAYGASQTLLNPMIRMIKMDEGISHGYYAPMEQDFGIDFSVPTIKTNIFVKEKYHMGLVVHRQFLDVCFSDKSSLMHQFPLSSGAVNISALISMKSKKIYKSSLSFLSQTNEIGTSEMENLSLCPMEIQAFTII